MALCGSSSPDGLGKGDSSKVEKSKRHNANANVNDNDKDGNVFHQVYTLPKDCVKTLLWSFGDKVESLQRSKSEEELDKLWEEADKYRKYVEVDSQVILLLLAVSNQCFCYKSIAFDFCLVLYSLLVYL